MLSKRTILLISFVLGVLSTGIDCREITPPSLFKEYDSINDIAPASAEVWQQSTSSFLADYALALRDNSIKHIFSCVCEYVADGVKAAKRDLSEIHSLIHNTVEKLVADLKKCSGDFDCIIDSIKASLKQLPDCQKKARDFINNVVDYVGQAKPKIKACIAKD